MEKFVSSNERATTPTTNIQRVSLVRNLLDILKKKKLLNALYCKILDTLRCKPQKLQKR